MPFRVPKILGEFNGKICSECISYNLEFQNFPGDDPCTPNLPERGKSPSQALPHLGLWRSVRASGTQLPLLYKLRLLLQFFLRTLPSQTQLRLSMLKGDRPTVKPS